jgi:putative membrane protein insertion efficiency factor
VVASGAARFYPCPLMRALVRILIRGYQITISPLLSWLVGASFGCRFSPTCSEYFLQAVEEHGVLRGSFLGVKRLLRCHPWGGSGFDPVPAADSLARSCVCE